ncbi:hypothetical protein DFH28DRAFT_1145759, partial [Melampsora americana]
MDNGPEDKCFAVLSHETDSTLFCCLACPGSRSMQVTRIRKHKMSASHRIHFRRWVADQDAAAAIQENSNRNLLINDHHVQIDQENEDDTEHQANIVPIELDQEESEFQRRMIVDLWTKDHSKLFGSPVLSVNSSQDDIIGIIDDISNHSGSGKGESEDSVDQKESQEKIQEDNDLWYPFSCLE